MNPAVNRIGKTFVKHCFILFAGILASASIAHSEMSSTPKALLNTGATQAATSNRQIFDGQPLPETYVLMLLGLAGLIISRRRNS